MRTDQGKPRWARQAVTVLAKLLAIALAGTALNWWYGQAQAALPAALLFLAGTYLVVEATEEFVEGILGTAVLLAVSPFALGVVFGGFDPENLGAGLAGAAQGLPGVALGTVIGSSTFLLTVALGLAALLVPLQVEVPRRHILLTLVSPLPLLLFSLDGRVARWEGLVLLLLFLPAIVLILQGSRVQGRAYQRKEEVEEVLEHKEERPVWFYLLLMIASLVFITWGAGLMGEGAKGLVQSLGISDTLLGMVFVAAAVCFEEIAREVIPAYRGHPEISIGNILGTVLFFALFNVGLIALAVPLQVEPSVLTLHWPFMLGALVLVSAFLLTRRVERMQGAVLLAYYALYLVASFGWGR
ncbi:MAG: hypothetical protein QJR13_09345 [Bacillota bacterium]|nr:hypothetical protein [Bacillota bacterium]